MSITREQIVVWVANNRAGYNSEADFIHQCFQDLSPVSEPVWVSDDVQEVIKAVAHIGIDWGYGVYELEQDKIDKARVLYERKLPAPPETKS